MEGRGGRWGRAPRCAAGRGRGRGGRRSGDGAGRGSPASRRSFARARRAKAGGGGEASRQDKGPREGSAGAAPGQVGGGRGVAAETLRSAGAARCGQVRGRCSPSHPSPSRGVRPGPARPGSIGAHTLVKARGVSRDLHGGERAVGGGEGRSAREGGGGGRSAGGVASSGMGAGLKRREGPQPGAGVGGAAGTEGWGKGGAGGGLWGSGLAVGSAGARGRWAGLGVRTALGVFVPPWG